MLYEREFENGMFKGNICFFIIPDDHKLKKLVDR